MLVLVPSLGGSVYLSWCSCMVLLPSLAGTLRYFFVVGFWYRTCLVLLLGLVSNLTGTVVGAEPSRYYCSGAGAEPGRYTVVLLSVPSLAATIVHVVALVPSLTGVVVVVLMPS